MFEKQSKYVIINNIKKFNKCYGTIIKILKNNKYKVKIYGNDKIIYYVTLNKHKFNYTTSYMRLCTNNKYLLQKYKNSINDKAVCIFCGWKKKNVSKINFGITDESTLICPNCNVDSIIIGNFPKYLYKKWHNEGFKNSYNPF